MTNKILAGTSGAAIGTGTACGAYAAAGAYGVAGTGTAIATLSGAAANTATLACLGGGSMIAGVVVLPLIGTGVALAAGYGIWKLIS